MQNIASSSQGKGSARLIGLVMALFFSFGFCTVLVDTIIPKLKATFALTYAEVMLTQFCFFGAYFIVSLPAAWLLARIGYIQGVVVGLLLMAAGCVLFTPAANAGIYPGFLGALFILASGVTIVQVAANPLATNAGDPASAPARLTLAQAANSVATTVGPFFGAAFIVSGHLSTPDASKLSPDVLAAARRQAAAVFHLPFLGIAAALILMAVLCWMVRRWVPRSENFTSRGYGGLLTRPRLMLGALSIFLYVGAEVSIGSSLANYLMLSRTLGAAPQTAVSMVSIYWGLAMVGRVIGAIVMVFLWRASPPLILTLCACGAGLLALASSISVGWTAAATILCVGLFNSIMFPTIFSLAIEGIHDRVSQASGILCLAIVGGAVVPLITGIVADHAGLNIAFLVPMLCYCWIALYGILTRNRWVDRGISRAPVIPVP